MKRSPLALIGAAFTAFYGLGALVAAPAALEVSPVALAAGLMASASAFAASFALWTGRAWRGRAFLGFGVAFPLFVASWVGFMPGPLPADAPRALVIGAVLWAGFVALIAYLLRARP